MSASNSLQGTGGNNRDEFSPRTKELIGKQAGYLCAFPGCRRLTVGPSDDRVSGVTMVGVAAHITAASVGGPRYDPALTHEERSSEHNGIWTCQTHGKMIDDNPGKYSVDDINRWKKQHENWVFSRLANAGNHLKNGISRISIRDVGVFDRRVDIKLGRYSVVYGANSAGKSTLCEAIAAFSGRTNYNHFANRFSFCRGSSGDSMIEAEVSQDDKSTTVTLIQQELGIRRAKHLPPAQRMRIEINGNTAPSWPHSLFNVVHLNEHIFESRRSFRRTFPHAVSALSGQLDVDKQMIWDMLHEEFFVTSMFGYQLKRTGVRTVNFLPPNGPKSHLPFALLASSEQALAIMDILLRLLRADPRNPPWLVALDSDFFVGLDRHRKEQVFDKITTNTDLTLQAVFTVHNEKDAETVKVAATDGWIGVSVVDGLTVHTFL